ncbi:MAG: hypothetical protein Q9227_009058 [Pyrenula ochraceoflavens]
MDNEFEEAEAFSWERIGGDMFRTAIVTQITVTERHLKQPRAMEQWLRDLQTKREPSYTVEEDFACDLGHPRPPGSPRNANPNSNRRQFGIYGNNIFQNSDSARYAGNGYPDSSGFENLGHSNRRQFGIYGNNIFQNNNSARYAGNGYPDSSGFKNSFSSMNLGHFNLPNSVFMETTSSRTTTPLATQAMDIQTAADLRTHSLP